MTMRITLLFEPSADRAIPFAAGPERYQRLADELGRYVGVQAQIVKDVLRKAPPDAYVLFAGSGNLSRSLADCGPVLAARLAPRIVLLDVSWQKALEQLEKHRLVGAVDSLRLSEWLARPSSCAGPLGLRYLAKPLGASCVPMPGLRSPHYCLLHSEQHRGMPHLLADYLHAYDRDQKPLSGVPAVSLARAFSAPIPWTASTAIDPRHGFGDAPIAQVECVGIRRVVASLKRLREHEGIKLAEMAELTGLDADLLDYLERDEYHGATLGTLRQYVLALEPKLGWTLGDSAGASFRRQKKPEEQMKIPRTTDQSFVVSGIGPGEAAADLAEFSPTTVERPWVLVEGGMTTLLGNRRTRRWEPEGEFDKSAPRTLEEESHAGV
jgi:hypothetical protein